MTDEQMAALLQTGDLGQQEMQMEQQNALAHQLRQQAMQPSHRMDAGSQIARGLQGGMAGLAMNQQAQGMKDYGAAKTAKLGAATDILMGRNRNPALQQSLNSRQVYGGTPAPTPEYDTAGF